MKCKKCGLEKDESEFYKSNGYLRLDCKKCFIKVTTRYQKKYKTWKCRIRDMDSHRQYMLKYYADNKEKFAKYRKSFLERHPNYYRDYQIERRNKKFERKKPE